MLKKVISLVLCVLLVSIGLCACNSGTQKSDDKLSVIATIFPAYDFVRQIAGDKVDLKMLMKPGGEVHSYAPSADDMLAINSCDLFISIGGESDAQWVADTLTSTGNDSIVSLKMMDCVEPVEEEVKDGMQAEEEHDDAEADEGKEEHEYDEHVWTSVRNAEKIVADITDKLCELDTVNAQTYRDNSHAYIAQLEELDSQLTSISQTAKYKTLIFADRFPMRYFCEDYGYDYFAAFNGCSASADPSADTISFLINKVKELNVPNIFTIEFSTGATADTISEATGAKRLELHSCHNVSQEGFDSGITYLQLMQRNAETLKEALN